MTQRDKSAEIPQHAIDALARCLLPEIQRYFESDKGKKEFEEWKASQNEASKKQGKKQKERET